MESTEAMFPPVRHMTEAQLREQGWGDIRAEAGADRLIAVAYRPEARSPDETAAAALTALLEQQRFAAAERALARAEALLPHHPATGELRRAFAALDAR